MKHRLVAENTIKHNFSFFIGWLRIIYIGKCYAIMLATATIIVLALATLGDATQIGLFLFMSLCQGKYKCRRHYRRHNHVNFHQWKHGFNQVWVQKTENN